MNIEILESRQLLAGQKEFLEAALVEFCAMTTVQTLSDVFEFDERFSFSWLETVAWTTAFAGIVVGAPLHPFRKIRDASLFLGLMMESTVMLPHAFNYNYLINYDCLCNLNCAPFALLDVAGFGVAIDMAYSAGGVAVGGAVVGFGASLLASNYVFEPLADSYSNLLRIASNVAVDYGCWKLLSTSPVLNTDMPEEKI